MTLRGLKYLLSWSMLAHILALVVAISRHLGSSDRGLLNPPAEPNPCGFVMCSIGSDVRAKQRLLARDL